MKNLKRVSLAMIFALILSGLVAWAQDEPYDDQQPVQDQQASTADRSNQPDPPGRAARARTSARRGRRIEEEMIKRGATGRVALF